MRIFALQQKAGEDIHGGCWQLVPWVYDGWADDALCGFGATVVFVFDNDLRSANSRYGSGLRKAMAQ